MPTRPQHRPTYPDLVPTRFERSPEEIEQDRREARLLATVSLMRSHRAIAKWLSIPCEKHDAQIGQKCSPFVGGVCRDRIEASRA